MSRHADPLLGHERGSRPDMELGMDRSSNQLLPPDKT